MMLGQEMPVTIYELHGETNHQTVIQDVKLIILGAKQKPQDKLKE